MNKILLILVILLGSILTFDVKALPTENYKDELFTKFNDFNDTNKGVEEGNTILLCEYKSSNSKSNVKFYYHLKTPNNNISAGLWDVFKGGSAKWKRLPIRDNISPIGETFGYFNQVISNNYCNKKSFNEIDFTCPKQILFDTDLSNEYCFSDDTRTSDKYDAENAELNYASNSIFNDINRYFTDTVFKEIIDTKTIISQNLNVYIANKTENYVSNKYKFRSTYLKPSFIENYISKIKDKKIKDLEYDNNLYLEYKNKYEELCKKLVEEGSLSEPEYKKTISYWPNSLAEIVGGRDINSIPHIPGLNGNDCNAILTPMMTEVVQNILNFIQFLGPIMVALFTIKDLLGPAMSGEQEAIKKVTERFKKRLLAAILLFFVPSIVNLILSITGVIPPSSCLK